MISTLADYDDASAFERSALAKVYPIVNPEPPRIVCDLRTNTIHVALSDTMGSDSRSQLVDELRPLLFGAAWKVLDLLIEYGLNSNVESRQNMWTIKDKADQAQAAACAPLSNDKAIWERVAASYSETVEHRHSLIHRLFVLTPTGDMSQMTDREGKSIPDLRVTEQEAFCRLVQGVATIVITQRFSNRERLMLANSLDALEAHHGHGPIGGGAQESVPPLIRTNAIHRSGTRWVVDTQAAAATAAEVFPGHPHYDIETNFPGSGFAPVLGRLEEAPRESRLELDLGNLPAWTEP